MKKYKGKYRSQTTRARFWDYGWNGHYFITINTKNRIRWFRKMVDGKMVLSEMGEVAETEWLKTFDMRPDMNLSMGPFVVMPDNFHAIIGVGENKYNSDGGTGRDAMHCVPTGTTHNQFGPQSKNLPSIIRGFKIGVTKNARLIDPRFAWQSRYHDHIIRNEEAFHRIGDYIIKNPEKW